MSVSKNGSFIHSAAFTELPLWTGCWVYGDQQGQTSACLKGLLSSGRRLPTSTQIMAPLTINAGKNKIQQLSPVNRKVACGKNQRRLLRGWPEIVLPSEWETTSHVKVKDKSSPGCQSVQLLSRV